MVKSLLYPFSIAFVLLSACATKEGPELNINLAGNRQMGIGLKTVRAKQAEAPVYFSKLMQKAISASYGSRVAELALEPNAPLESPENIYHIGRLELDDVFVVEAIVHGNFEIPTTSQAASVTEESANIPAELADNFVEFSVSIYNGSNLRAVNVFSFKVSAENNAAFESSALAAFKKTSIGAYPNPNIYPKSDPRHFANLLYAFSESREKESTSQLTCEEAPTRLKYYAAAKELYDLASARGTTKAYGTQSESHQLTSRTADCAAKAKIVEDCIADQSKTFEIDINYGSMAEANQPLIKKAFDKTNLEPLLKQYTAKPVKFRFQVEKDGHVNLFVDLRFDRSKFKAWTMNRIPQRIKTSQILSLDPYYAIMQKLVVLRSSLPPEAPFSLRSGFENMRMMMNLTTLINGEVSFAVDGKLQKDQKHLTMAYPNGVYITYPGFDKRLVQNRDAEVFQEKGWIALGNCKTIEGTKTEDGLVYDFFGLPCQ